jgi:hypothetical protein
MNVAVWGEAGGGVMQLQQDECCDGTHECNDDQELFQLVIPNFTSADGGWLELHHWATGDVRSCLVTDSHHWCSFLSCSIQLPGVH